MSVTEFIYTVLLKPSPLRKATNFAIKSILPQTSKVKGAVIHLNPNDPVISGALTLNVYEKDEIDFFTKWFQPEMNFIDIGANVGLYSALALRTQKSVNSMVLCIEPDPNSLVYLKRTLASNKTPNSNVVLCPVAASDKEEKIFLYKNFINKGDNRIYADPLLDQIDEVYSKKLDTLCAENGIKEVGFLKIDVQGAEFKAISGGYQILQQSRNCILMTEFWPYGLYKCNSSPNEYINLLRELGFVLFELEGQRLSYISETEFFISRCTGRKYKNLVCLKGSHLLKQNFKKTF
jgi:FkbM family methyltransferase